MGNSESRAGAAEGDSADRQSPSLTNTARRRRTGLALVDQAVVSGANFLVAAVLGRCCGVEEFGLYALGNSLVILTLVVHEGLILTPHTLRLGGLDEGESRELAGQTLAMSIGFAALAMLGFGLMGLACVGSGIELNLAPVLLAVAVALPFLLWRDLTRRMDLAALRVRAATLVDTTATVATLSLIAVLLLMGRLEASSAIVAAGIGCGMAAAGWSILNRGRFAINLNTLQKGVVCSLRLGGWITASRLANVAGYQAVPWLLTLRLGTAETGGFAAAATLVAVSNPLLMGLGSIYLPEAVNDHARGGVAALRRSTRRITWTMSVVAGVSALVIALAAEPALGFVYGPSFERFATVAALLAAASVLSVLGFGAETGLRILKKPSTDFLASTPMLPVVAVATIVLAERCGALAGAIGLLLGVAAATIAHNVAFARLCPEPPRSGASPALSQS